MTRISLFIGFVMIISTTTLYAGENRMRITSGLLSKNPLERQSTYNEVLAQRENIIRQLLAILERKDADASYQGFYHRAIVLLGKLRAKEAVERLANILEYVPENFETEEMLPSQAYYVAAQALVQIGQPSIPAMMTKIKHAGSLNERNLAVWVVMEIEGKDQALNRFETAAAKAGASHEHAFVAAREYIRNFKVTFGNPLLKQ